MLILTGYDDDLHVTIKYPEGSHEPIYEVLDIMNNVKYIGRTVKYVEEKKHHIHDRIKYTIQFIQYEVVNCANNSLSS